MVSVSQPGGDDLRPGTTAYPRIQTAIMKIASPYQLPTYIANNSFLHQRCNGDVLHQCIVFALHMLFADSICGHYFDRSSIVAVMQVTACLTKLSCRTSSSVLLSSKPLRNAVVATGAVLPSFSIAFLTRISAPSIAARCMSRTSDMKSKAQSAPLGFVRVRRLAHSLKRDIGLVAARRKADSPMSMTSPRTTLKYGHNMHHCPIGLPWHRIPLCHIRAATCFFGAICGRSPITSLMWSST